MIGDASSQGEESSAVVDGTAHHGTGSQSQTSIGIGTTMTTPHYYYVRNHTFTGACIIIGYAGSVLPLHYNYSLSVSVIISNSESYMLRCILYMYIHNVLH